MPITGWRGIAGLTALLAAWLFLAWPAPGLAAEPDLARAQQLLAEGKAADAYALLEPYEIDKAGDPLYDYLLATAALRTGRASKATFIYERILAVAPNYAGVRADMARAYYDLGDFARARLEFELVLRLENLPPDLRAAVQQYVAAIDRLKEPSRTALRGYVLAGYGRDSNINSAAGGAIIIDGTGQIINPGADLEKRSDNYWGLQAGGEASYQASERVNAFVAADYFGRYYTSFSEANYGILDARFGASYAGGPYQVTGTAYLGRYWLDDRPIRDNSGLSGDWRYSLSANNQVSARALLMRYRYEGRFAANDIDLGSVTLGWTRAIASGTAVSLFFGVGREQATNSRPDGDKDFWGPRLSFQTSLLPQVGLFATAGAQKGKYQEDNFEDLSFTRRSRREDWFYDATVGIYWSFVDRWSLQPQFSWTRNDSNHSTADFDRTELSISIRRDFY